MKIKNLGKIKRQKILRKLKLLKFYIQDIDKVLKFLNYKNIL